MGVYTVALSVVDMFEDASCFMFSILSQVWQPYVEAGTFYIHSDSDDIP